MRLTDEQIGAELHALRETPSERVAAELDQRVADGFPPPEAGSDVRDPAGTWRNRLAPLLRPRLALGAAATLLLALIVSVAVVSNLDRESQTTSIDSGGDADVQAPQSLESGRAGDAAAEELPKSSIEPAPGGGVVAPEPTTVPPSQPPIAATGDGRPRTGRERVQERSAQLGLSTEPDQLQDVADGVVEVTDRYRGIVDSSTVQSGGERGRADFSLRIPSTNLQAALSDLSDLAHVISRNEGTLDITSPFVDIGERFHDARAEVDSLLEQLAEADSASETASLKQQLVVARSELAGARSQLRIIKTRAELSVVSVTITAQGDGDGWSIGDAVDDSVDVLEALGGAALVTLAVLIPLGGIAALLWLGLRQLRRRARERALDKS